MQMSIHSINVKREWNCSLPSVPYCWWPFSSTISHLLSLLQSVTLLTVHSVPTSVYQICTVLPYISRYWTVRLKMFSLSFVFVFWGFPHSSVGKESTCNAGVPGLIPGSGRSAGEGIGYPLQYAWASSMAQLVENTPAMQETWVHLSFMYYLCERVLL